MVVVRDHHPVIIAVNMVAVVAAVVGVAPVPLQIRVIPEMLVIPALLHHTIVYPLHPVALIQLPQVLLVAL